MQLGAQRDLGKIVKYFRESQDLTQTELALRVGTNTTGISNLENGHTKNPGILFLQDIAKELNVPAAALLAPVEYDCLYKLISILEFTEFFVRQTEQSLLDECTDGRALRNELHFCLEILKQCLAALKHVTDSWGWTSPDDEAPR